jgi:hypothetical protein
MPAWFSFGKKRSFLEAEAEHWQLATWQWLLRHLGPLGSPQAAPIVTPTRAFFPQSDAEGHARAEHIFAAVKRNAGMTEWECRLIAQERRPEVRVGDVAVLNFEGPHALGTFGRAGNAAVITYEPTTVEDAALFVAIMAHELAHYRLAALPEEPPGGADGHEPATDLATVYMGFGLFGANYAFNFQRHQDFVSQGWQWSRQGYLGEREWIFALAVFLELRAQSSDDVAPFLKSHLVTDLRRARRHLGAHPELLAPLRAI